MRRGLVVAAAAAAVLATGLTGCSKDEKASGSSASTSASANSSSASEATSGGGESTAGSGNPQVSIDGKAQDFHGKVECGPPSDSGMRIEVGDHRDGGMMAILTDANPPVVKTVATLGFPGRVTLQYPDPGAPGGEATAVKDGNTYKISGTAPGYKYPKGGPDPTETTMIPFEITVTCP
ncbi:lipoprotein LpqH [Mycobacteroides abscessus]|uniref:19 kDa lipoprotein, LpqH n=2 Tax=Mycobacteroides abscessus TaxID=36809 RepID=A0AB38D2P2_9MYCO|nr:lipoprotein LpqH [Mycobacteroides abscessus]MBE5419568.1 hypothetical protein [Mycobacteroides abscessus]MBE5455733.1 hypothetical protein [Mycobacteroides abscessus]MBN7555251.1 lipoprotein LpqH [Mycobacteroides abscessus subsp. abscessus]MDM2404643.1 lipoprotein LpqH [Mycobacteroides abscessus]MDM2414361.1 lipoprotein LpqH [Mycobacteroides abscessus]